MAHAAPVERSADDWTASERVVSAVADRIGADPAALDPLYEVVDPDALDALFEPRRLHPDRSDPRVSFAYCGCDVVVSADGGVRVT